MPARQTVSNRVRHAASFTQMILLRRIHSLCGRLPQLDLEYLAGFFANMYRLCLGI